MNKPFFRTALFYALLSGGFILLDLTIDRLVGATSEMSLPHIILAVVAVLVSFILLSRAMETRRRAEAVLRQARDELDTRVRERTAELERTNEALQNEIKERQLAEQERARSLVQVEYARQRAEALASELQLSNSMLQVSEERHRTQFDNFSEPTTVWDRNGVLLMQNLISSRNLGGKREDFIGKTIYEIFGDAAKGYMERMARVMDRGITENQEDVVELHFGKRYFWTCMQRVQNPDGQYAVQIISYDITDRKRVEEELRASEGKFSTVFHFSPDAIGIVRGADGTFLDVNEAFTKILGYPHSDILGKTWQDLNLIPRTDERNKIVERFLEKGSVSEDELVFTTREGKTVTMLLSLVPITVSSEPCILAIAHDITEHKRAEKLLGSQVRLMAFAVSHSLEELLQKTLDEVSELTDSPIGFYHFVEADQRTISLRAWSTRTIKEFCTAQGKGQHYNIDEAGVWVDCVHQRRPVIHNDYASLPHRKGMPEGHAKVIRELVVPIVHEDQIMAILGIGNKPSEYTENDVDLVSNLANIAWEITERKRAEEDLRLAQDELALGIQERAALEERQRLARELHDSVSQALYGISLGAHTALTLFDTDRPKVLEALNYILSLVQAGLTEMRALIFELRPESLEAEGLVTALTKQTAAIQARHEIEVELTLCDEPDVPLPMKEALYRIAQEAFHNAVKHGRPSRLDVRLAREPDRLRLEISDNGVGFDPSTAYPGHLGLRSMRERAMRAGGTLDITSVPLNGTQILACIPLR